MNLSFSRVVRLINAVLEYSGRKLSFQCVPFPDVIRRSSYKIYLSTLIRGNPKLQYYGTTRMLQWLFHRFSFEAITTEMT